MGYHIAQDTFRSIEVLALPQCGGQAAVAGMGAMGHIALLALVYLAFITRANGDGIRCCESRTPKGKVLAVARVERQRGGFSLFRE